MLGLFSGTRDLRSSLWRVGSFVEGCNLLVGACGILVPQPGIEPMPPALEAQSLNHWSAREVPHFVGGIVERIKALGNQKSHKLLWSH